MKLIAPTQSGEPDSIEQVTFLAVLNAVARKRRRVIGMLLIPGQPSWFGHLAAQHPTTKSPYWTTAWTVETDGTVTAWQAGTAGVAVN